MSTNSQWAQGAFVALAAFGAFHCKSPQQSLPMPPSLAPPPFELSRGGEFMGSPERFNRYYTDSTYQAKRILYVNSTGGGDGATRKSPMRVEEGLAAMEAGSMLYFLAESQPYSACHEIGSEQSGSYDEPIVLFAERNTDGSRGVHLECCGAARQACFNLEASNYIAIDGFHFVSGRYGIRAVGRGFAPQDNQLGIAMLNNHGENQCADAFFTGQSSWVAVEANLAEGGGSCDGHGIYLSNGGDYGIVRGNELHSNSASDLQINADPIFTCKDEGIDYDDPRCDGRVIDGEGQGVSEFILVENNYLHHSEIGPNFTSVRSSVVRNNIMGPYNRHNTSFWQETRNPNLGSSGNQVLHNLFIGNSPDDHNLQFINNSHFNEVHNNLSIALNDEVLVIENRGDNTISGNVFVGGKFVGHSPAEGELRFDELDPSWFADFSESLEARVENFVPQVSAPFVNSLPCREEAGDDLRGQERRGRCTPGPLEEE